MIPFNFIGDGSDLSEVDIFGVVLSIMMKSLYNNVLENSEHILI